MIQGIYTNVSLAPLRMAESGEAYPGPPQQAVKENKHKKNKNTRWKNHSSVTVQTIFPDRNEEQRKLLIQYCYTWLHVTNSIHYVNHTVQRIMFVYYFLYLISLSRSSLDIYSKLRNFIYDRRKINTVPNTICAWNH